MLVPLRQLDPSEIPTQVKSKARGDSHIRLSRKFTILTPSPLAGHRFFQSLDPLYEDTIYHIPPSREADPSVTFQRMGLAEVTLEDGTMGFKKRSLSSFVGPSNAGSRLSTGRQPRRSPKTSGKMSLANEKEVHHNRWLFRRGESRRVHRPRMSASEGHAATRPQIISPLYRESSHEDVQYLATNL